MPDFRARVHRGETFLVAGDRFAIGSSREMSPAGLKGVAEEKGLELVVVCGHNMGDIFRRNAFNLGLHVVQSPEAVDDARDGDEFAFDPATRRLTNETQGKTYEPVPLTPKEEEIRSSGGIFAVGRREFRASVAATPAIDWPEPELARRMTTTEQIVWAHRVDRDAAVQPGRDAARLRGPAARLRRHGAVRDPHVQPDHRRATRSSRARRPSPTITSSSPAATTTTSRPAIGREFAAPPRPREAVLRRRRATASSTSTFRSRGSCCPASSSPAPTRTAAPTAPTARSASASARRRSASAGRPATSTSRWPGSAASCSSGTAPAVGQRQGHRARAAAPLGAEAVAGHVGRVRRRERQLPIAYRNTIANMMAEAEALNGIFAADDITDAWYRAKGIGRSAVSADRARRRRGLRDRRDARRSRRSRR